MSFKDLEQKHNLVNRVILACGKRPTDADINPLLEERLEQFYEDAVIEGMAKPWVGLTDDDHKDFANRTKLLPILAKTLAEFIEAKLKEKNT